MARWFLSGFHFKTRVRVATCHKDVVMGLVGPVAASHCRRWRLDFALVATLPGMGFTGCFPTSCSTVDGLGLCGVAVAPYCSLRTEELTLLSRGRVGWVLAFVQGVKKPFNPIIGETFACAWRHDDGSLSQYFAEQVWRGDWHGRDGTAAAVALLAAFDWREHCGLGRGFSLRAFRAFLRHYLRVWCSLLCKCDCVL